MTYEEYGVWLEWRVADCPDGEGREMLKMCLAKFMDTHALPEKNRYYCQNENMGRCRGYAEKPKQCTHGIPMTFSCPDCKKEDI